MALRWASSFDNIQDSDCATFFSSTSVGSPDGAQMNAASTYSRWPSAPIGRGFRTQVCTNGSIGNSRATLTFDAQSTWIIGAAVKTVSWPDASRPDTQGGPCIFSLRVSGNLVFELRQNSGGALFVSRNTTAIGSAGAVMSSTTFSFLELKVTVHPTAGSYEVRLNGVTYLSGSGVNTSGQGGTTADSIDLGTRLNTGAIACAETWYDDMYIADGTGSGLSIRDFVGDCRPYELLPAGNGTFSDWAQTGGTGGSPYTAVNDTPNNGDTSYLASGTINARTTLTYPPAPAGTIKAVIMAPWFRKDDANSHTVAARVYRAGVESTSAQTALPGTSYTMKQIVMETDPADGSAWTTSKISASEFGLVVAS